MKRAVVSSNQKAIPVWPAGKIAARSFNETPTTFDSKFVANRNSSVMVETKRLLGDIFPSAALTAPTPCTVLSLVQ